VADLEQRGGSEAIGKLGGSRREDTKKMVVTVVSAVFNGKNDSQKKRHPVDRRRRPDAWRKVQGRKKRGNTNEMVVVKRERVPLRY